MKITANLIIKIIICGIIIYTILALILWLSTNIYDGRKEKTSRLVNFSQKYQKILQVNVFDQIINESRQCDLLMENNCYKQVGVKLSSILSEEELNPDPTVIAVNDLAFIKREGQSFYQLNWDGKTRTLDTKIQFIKDIETSNQLITQSNCGLVINLNTDATCRIIVKVYETKDQAGYLMRLHPLTEEHDFTFWFIFIPFTMPWFLIKGLINL